MFTKIVAVLLIVSVAFLGFAYSRPDTIVVARTTTINAPPEKIYPLIADFKQWPAWSPWEKRDPSMQRTLGGAGSGKGATYAWSGNREVGAGRMEIVEATAPSKLGIKLDFLAPLEGHNDVEFTLTPKGGATDVKWVMTQPHTSFLGKLLGIFFDVEKMIGTDFEAGLASLKAAAEK